VEAYKYTDLKARLRTLPPAAGAPDLNVVDDILAATPPLVEGAHRIVLANGRLLPERSTAPEGMAVASLLAPEADLAGVGALVIFLWTGWQMKRTGYLEKIAAD